MSPLEIRLLLHIYAMPGEIPDRGYSAQKSALDGFVDQGLVTVMECKTADEHEFRITERGAAYVNALTSLPLPVAYWRIPAPPENPVGMVQMSNDTWRFTPNGVSVVRGYLVPEGHSHGGIPIPD